MKLPRIATITVVDSPEKDKRHNINIHLEILHRKLLNIFANNSGEYGAVGTELRKEVTKYEWIEYGLENERLLTPEFFDAVIKDNEVSII